MKNTSIRHALKSASCNYSNDQEDLQNSAQGLLQSEGKNNSQEKEINEGNFTRGYKSCSDTLTYSQVSEASHLQPNNSEAYEQLSLLKSTPTLKQSCDRTSQEYQFTQTSEVTAQSQSLTLSQWDFPAQVHQMRELERVSNILHPHSGEKGLDVSCWSDLNSALSNNLKELSDEDLELFLGDSDWQDIKAKLKQSRRRSLEQDTRDSDYLSFPTLTSNENSTTRPAGQTKCERWFRNKGLIPNGSQLGSQAIATIMGFPPNWFDCLSPTEHQEESEVDTSQVEPLPQDKQPSPSAESSISIPCLIRQPHKQPFEGLIVGDRGSEFDVEVNSRIVTLPKLYVFPNFTNFLKKKKCQTDDDISPSKIPQRRKKGTGSGYINWRDIRKNGKDYKQTWFHYELWDKGRQVKSCAYIPKGKRSQVEKMNAEKVPVEEILGVLKNRSKRKK